jgi:hypothetical protein
MPHPNNFHGTKLPTAFDDWPCPQEGFSVPTYEYKSWSMDPNLVPPHLVPPHAHGAGDFPLQVSGVIFDDQKKRRDDIMTAHNLTPQMLAQSIFPNVHTIVRYDEVTIDLMLFGEKKTIADSVSGLAPVQQVSANPSSVEVKCFQFLLQDFMKMYREVTGQSLFKPPNNKQHMDLRYIGSSVNMPSTKFNAGKKVKLWCSFMMTNFYHPPPKNVLLLTTIGSNPPAALLPMIQKKNQYHTRKVPNPTQHKSPLFLRL